MADVHGLDDDTRWEIAVIVAELQGRAVKARADFETSTLDDLPLEFVRDDHPFERHGNILGLPVGRDDDSRMRRKELATVLAAASTLVLPSD